MAINAPSSPTTSTHFPIPMPSLDNEGYLPPYGSYPEGPWGSDINYAGPSLNLPVPPPPIATSPNVAEQGSDLDNHRADVPDNASPDSDSASDRNAEDDDWQDDDDYYDEEEEAIDDDYGEEEANDDGCDDEEEEEANDMALPTKLGLETVCNTTRPEMGDQRAHAVGRGVSCSTSITSTTAAATSITPVGDDGDDGDDDSHVGEPVPALVPAIKKPAADAEVQDGGHLPACTAPS